MYSNNPSKLSNFSDNTPMGGSAIMHDVGQRANQQGSAMRRDAMMQDPRAQGLGFMQQGNPSVQQSGNVGQEQIQMLIQRLVQQGFSPEQAQQRVAMFLQQLQQQQRPMGPQGGRGIPAYMRPGVNNAKA